MLRTRCCRGRRQFGPFSASIKAVRLLGRSRLRKDCEEGLVNASQHRDVKHCWTVGVSGQRYQDRDKSPGALLKTLLSASGFS